MLRDGLVRISEEYPLASKEVFSGHSLGNFVRNEFTKSLEQTLNLADTNIIIKASVGQSVWADVPWIVFMDALVTNSILRGYYVGYLYSADMNRVYLTMAQGVTGVKEEFGMEWISVLHQRAALIRSRVPAYKDIFSKERIDLAGRTSLAKSYEETPAFSKMYSTTDMPSEDQLLEELNNMLDLYSQLTYSGGTDLVEHPVDSLERDKHLTVSEKKLYREHRRVEGRVNSKKVKDYRGYICEACGFDFEEFYGDLGHQYIEAHHLKPYSDLGPGKLRKLDLATDFAVLCANCHKMIHRLESPGDLDGLISKIRHK